MKAEELLAWIDIETTGLDVTRDRLLEVAIIVTDQQLNELARNRWVMFFAGRIEDSHEIVQEMHTKSGLWQDAFESSLAEVTWRREFASFLGIVLGEHREYNKFVMAGSGVARFDYKWFETHYPEIIREFFNYYTLDIGVVRRALELSGWFPDDHDDEKPKSADDLSHRAMDDIEDHLAEWKLYRGMLEESWGVIQHGTLRG